MPIPSRNLTLLLAVAALLGGCGSGSHSGAPAGAAAAAAAARKALNPADEMARNMVGAVALNKSATAVPVQVRFQLHDRPQVDQPVDINLVLVPLSGAVDRVSGKIESDDGLEVVDGAQIPTTERPTEGAPIRHTIKVLPKRDGIFTFSAVVTVESSGQSSTETFSMPVIAGAGMPDLPAKPASAAPGGTMPATATAASAKGAPGRGAAAQ